MADAAARIIARLKKNPRIIGFTVIIAAVFLVYWPALRNGFVWDDTALVLRDPLIRSWRLIPEGFRHFLFLDATASDFYRPLQRVGFTFDYALYGLGAPWGWHLTSIALHAAAAVALFHFACRFIGGERAGGLALAIAAVWAVHPLHTSAVTYVAGRADPLAALFGFTALTLGLRSLDGGKRAWLATLGATVCFLGAMLSKESGIVALLVWLLLLAWRRPGWMVARLWFALSFLVLGSYITLRGGAERTPPPPPPAIAAAVRPILAARAVAEYAGLLVFPRTLRMERDVTTFPQATPEATLMNARLRQYQTLLGVILILALGAWFRWSWRRAPGAAWSLAAFAIAYLPISNAFSLNATVAEHWLYVPSAFLLMAAVLSVRTSREGGAQLDPWKKIVWRFAFAAWLGFLAARTFARQLDWRDQRTFLERTIRAGGDTPRMHINLGNVEFQAGNLALAIFHYREAIEREPAQAMAHLALAKVSLRTGDTATARASLAIAEKVPLLAADCLQTRAAIEYLETGRDTGDLLVQAAETAPRFWPARRRVIEHLDQTGRTAEAARELRDFLVAQPFRAEAFALLGTLLRKLGHEEHARAAFAEAVRLDVRYTPPPAQ